jgi:hypothetical protein
MDIDDAYEKLNLASNEDNKIYQSIADNYTIDKDNEIQSLHQQLVVKDLEVMKLREAWEKVLDNTYSLSPKADFIIEALSTTHTPDHLMAWYKEQLGEVFAWYLNTGHGSVLEKVKPKCEIDKWQPLYAPKLDMKG